MAATGKFLFLNVEELQEMKADYKAALKAILVRGTTYTIAGRSFGFTDERALRDGLEEIGFALGRKTNQSSDCVRANFNPSLGRPR